MILGALKLADPVLLGVAVTLAIASGVLIGVIAADIFRSELPRPLSANESGTAHGKSSFTEFILLLFVQTPPQEVLRAIRVVTAVAAAIAIALLLFLRTSNSRIATTPALLIAAVCLVGASFAASTVGYFASIETERLPESRMLGRGARVVAWLLLAGAVSVGLEWAHWTRALSGLLYAILIVDAVLCYALLDPTLAENNDLPIFALGENGLSVFGARANIFASIVDFAQRQLGIDLRSTWAMTVVRRSIEPLLLSLAIIGWLSTSFSVVGLDEQAIIERFGVRLTEPALHAGLHVHMPWPIDKIYRFPMLRVQSLEIGHEGVEAPGPENVLWAVEHAPNEFTLLLGNGRDLITVDAGVQFRIVDAGAWLYHCQNPVQALSAISYRAVMRNTVNLTLSDALSQNIFSLSQRMRSMIQRDADALGLGVEILGFTVGGMHPPVAVAQDYQAVVSAELRKVTAVVTAQVERTVSLPDAKSSALSAVNRAHAEAAESLAKAAGEAWSFRILESQYRAAPNLYFFRRRLEALENGLTFQDLTVIDSRFQKSGGEIWLTR